MDWRFSESCKKVKLEACEKVKVTLVLYHNPSSDSITIENGSKYDRPIIESIVIELYKNELEGVNEVNQLLPLIVSLPEAREWETKLKGAYMTNLFYSDRKSICLNEKVSMDATYNFEFMKTIKKDEINNPSLRFGTMMSESHVEFETNDNCFSKHSKPAKIEVDKLDNLECLKTITENNLKHAELLNKTALLLDMINDKISVTSKKEMDQKFFSTNENFYKEKEKEYGIKPRICPKKRNKHKKKQKFINENELGENINVDTYSEGHENEEIDKQLSVNGDGDVFVTSKKVVQKSKNRDNYQYKLDQGDTESEYDILDGKKDNECYEDYLTKGLDRSEIEEFCGKNNFDKSKEQRTVVKEMINCEENKNSRSYSNSYLKMSQPKKMKKKTLEDQKS